MAWWLWLLIGILLILSESVIPLAFYLFFFGVSACVLSILLGLGVPLSTEIQWVLFPGLAVLLILGLRRFVAKPHVNGSSTDMSSLIGDVGLTLSGIPAGGDGHVEVRGSQWGAKNVSTTSLGSKARVKVVGMHGLTLDVVPEK